jgi:hypothetical protein
MAEQRHIVPKSYFIEIIKVQKCKPLELEELNASAFRTLKSTDAFQIRFCNHFFSAVKVLPRGLSKNSSSATVLPGP